MQRLRAVVVVLIGALLVTAVSACGEDDAIDPTKTVEIAITVKDGNISPVGERVKVARDQPIDLVVTSDAAGSLHVHSDPEQEFAYEAGTQTFKIAIGRPGVVAVESHELDQVIVQLEVK